MHVYSNVVWFISVIFFIFSVWYKLFQLTDYFCSRRGLGQENLLSPYLFVLYYSHPLARLQLSDGCAA